ncbi:Chromodomain-helicase-DNA-binding protein 9, partial [Xenoophorus captivus]
SSSEKRLPRRKHHQMESNLHEKQEKANRIISEAIAKARQRGEKNIPRVMSPESFPSSSAQYKTHCEREHKGNGKARTKEKASRKACIVPSSKSKQKTKIGYVDDFRSLLNQQNAQPIKE